MTIAGPLPGVALAAPDLSGFGAEFWQAAHD